MSNFINAICPHCGTEHEEVPEEYVGEKIDCLNCGREFIVADVTVHETDFVNGDATVTCPHCGDAILAPLASVDRNVRCCNCHHKFHISFKRRKTAAIIQHKPTPYQPPQNQNRAARFLIAVGIFVVIAIGWVIYGPTLVFRFHESTGLGADLVEKIYDDNTCSVFCTRAGMIGDVETCEKWANRTRGEMARKIAFEQLRLCKDIKRMKKQYRW